MFDPTAAGQRKSDSENGPITQAAGNPECAADPDGRYRCKTGHVTTGIAQNYARSQKADSGEDRAVSDEGSQHSDEDCGHALLSRVNDPPPSAPGMENSDDRECVSCRENFFGETLSLGL